MVKTFDSSKLWISSNTRRYHTPTREEIIKMSLMISRTYGGILNSGICITIGEVTIYSPCDTIVIEDHMFSLVHYIGQGVFGKVYKGYDFTNKKLVAIKCQPMNDTSMILKQAAATRRNGIGLFDVSSNIGPSFLCDKKGYFVLPLADISFEQWYLQKITSAQYDLIIKALIKIGKDLIKLHASGNCHLDLKMDNILMIDDIAYLSDFGRVEKIGSYIKVIHADPKIYCQYPPEYMSCVKVNQPLRVCENFDGYSFGFLIVMVSKYIRNPKIKQELFNISTHIRRFHPETRMSIANVIKYLEVIIV